MNEDDNRYEVSKEWILKNIANGDDELAGRLHEKIAGELEKRVGNNLATRMTDEQLDKFEELIDGRDEDAQLSYLEGIVPDYKEVVGIQADALKKELTEAGGTDAVLALTESWQ